MRVKSAWACAGAAALAIALFWGFNGPAASQDTPEDGSDVSTQPSSSLDQGRPFDRHAQQQFLSTLTGGQHGEVVELRSRFAIVDPACPLPGSDNEVFYLKLRNPMDAGFARHLMDAGAAFVGYAYPNAHFVRIRDAAARETVGGLLRGSDNVAGTLLRHEMDSASPALWEAMGDALPERAEYRLLFWGDVASKQAAEWLNEHDIALLKDPRDPQLDLDLDIVRFVDVALAPQQVQVALNCPWIEQVDFKPVLAARNANSTALARAAPADIGPATSYNLTGQGLVVGVWDGGTARPTHVAFQGASSPSPFAPYFPSLSGRVLVAPVIAGKSPSWGLPDNSGISDHPCHVTGTVVSDGTGNAAARGYATEAFAVSMGWGSMEAERQAIHHYLRIVADNHSYGNAGGGTGGYDASAQASDIDTRDILLNMCKSAGNSGPNDNTLTDDSCMKNALVIGASDDAGVIASFSSRGPADDGRLLPHFMANGVNLTSTLPNSDTSFGGPGWSGTSMSSPSTCGGVTLLAELWQREMGRQFMAPDVTRAILAATALDRGNAGPDYRYGWGQIDIKRAADLILAHKNNQNRHIVRGQVRQSAVVEYPLTVTSSAQPLRVVLSWLDIYASTGAGTKLVNDLDLELVEPNGTTVHLPWRGLTSSGSQTTNFTRGVNRRDNLEVAEVSNPVIGSWKVRVRGFNIPALPQPTVLNNVVGFVLASERPILHSQEFIADPLNTGAPVNIPDNNATGVSRTFNFTSAGTVTGVRVYLDVRHPRRGDINVFLVAPDNTTVQLESSDTSTRRDVIGVFPDTRQYDDDVTAVLGKNVAGTWTVRVNDVNAGPTSTSIEILPGVIRYLAVEIDSNAGGGGGNNVPVADAGPNQTVNEGTPVTLDGGSSFDVDGDPLTFSWAQIGGPAAVLSGANTAVANFTAPLVGSNQMCTFQLTVDDGNGGVSTDTVAITVLDVPAPNTPPIADAGVDFSVTSGLSASLNGTASFDPDGDPLTYAWTQLAGTTVTLVNSSSATAGFLAPNVAVPELVTIELVVDDGRGGSASDTVNVTINPVVVNNPPVANAGADVQVKYNDPVTLDAGASSDPDGDPLTFLWTQIGGVTQIVLTNPTQATPSFTAPTVDDVLVFQVLVDDGRGEQSVDSVTVTVTANGGSSGGGSDKKGEEGCSTGDHDSIFWIAVVLLVLCTLALRRRRTAR